jgi:glycine C-acetyltransferase
MSWITEKAHAELQRVRDAQAKQIYPYFRPFESGGLHTTIAGKPIVNFSSNDYLGLTNHPKVKEAAKAAVDRFACGLSSSRVQATATLHVQCARPRFDFSITTAPRRSIGFFGSAIGRTR